MIPKAARLQRESRPVELRNGSAVLDEAEFPALSLAARIVRIFFRQLGEIRAMLQLFQDVFGLGLRGRVSFRIRLCRDLDENMAHADLLRHLELLLMLVVIPLHIRARKPAADRRAPGSTKAPLLDLSSSGMACA